MADQNERNESEAVALQNEVEAPHQSEAVALQNEVEAPHQNNPYIVDGIQYGVWNRAPDYLLDQVQDRMQQDSDSDTISIIGEPQDQQRNFYDLYRGNTSDYDSDSDTLITYRHPRNREDYICSIPIEYCISHDGDTITLGWLNYFSYTDFKEYCDSITGRYSVESFVPKILEFFGKVTIGADELDLFYEIEIGRNASQYTGSVVQIITSQQMHPGLETDRQQLHKANLCIFSAIISELMQFEIIYERMDTQVTQFLVNYQRPNEPQRIRLLNLSPQGDLDARDTAEAGSALQVERSANVDLIENRGDKIAIPLVAKLTPKSLMAFSHPCSTFPDLTDRWNNIETFTWDVSEESGPIKLAYELPRDIIPILTSNPATLPLLQYLYWRPQMTMRFQLNSTRFHSGMLIVGVKYYSGLDSDLGSSRIPSRVEQLWQLDYATINAAGSNVVEVQIPYQSPFDEIPIRIGAVGSSSYYASVYVAVVSPLRIGDGGSTSVTVTSQIQLSCNGNPTEFYGQITRLTLTPEGISDAISGIANTVGTVANIAGGLGIPGAGLIGSIAGTAGGLVSSIVKPIESLFGGLGSIFKASNMDKPVKPLEYEPVSDYPTASMSWGEGVSQARILRLNPATTTPHHPGTVPMGGIILDEKVISRTWGYVTSFQISTETEVDDLLLSLPITPMQIATIGNDCLPTPMAGIAGMYTYWSGPIEIKLIFVKADPHSFRIRTSFNPGNPSENGNQLVNLVSEIQDVQEITELTSITPYFAPVKALPVIYADDALYAGTYEVRLESRLISMNSVASTIDVIVLARASTETEFMIPKQVYWKPTISTNPNPNGFDRIILFNAISPAASYDYSEADGSLSQPIREARSSRTIDFNIFQYIYSNKDVIVIQRGSSWTTIPVTEYLGRRTIVFPRDDMGPDTATTDNIIEYRTFNFNKINYAAIVFPSNLSAQPNFIIGNKYSPSLQLTPQGEEERTDTGNEQSPEMVPTAGISQVLVGEDFGLRSSLRRYQQYFKSTQTLEPGLWKFEFDAQFGTIGDRKSGQRITNLTFCHDGFRFAKGGLNYIMHIESTNGPVKPTVYHLPGGIVGDQILDVAWVPMEGTEQEELSFYAHDLIGDDYHNIPFNVPYMNYTNFLVNGYDSDASGIGSIAAYCFGRVIISIQVESSTTLTLRLERSLADDADLYVFQGWPVCTGTLTYNNINTTEPLPTTTRNSKRLENVKADPAVQQRGKLTQKVGPLAWIIESLPRTRRGQKVVKKMITKYAQGLKPEGEGDALSAAELVEVDGFLSTLATKYLTKCKFDSNYAFPRSIHEAIGNEGIATLLLDWIPDEEIQMKAIYTDIAIRTFGYFSNTPNTFFEKTGVLKPNATIFTKLRKVASLATGLIPASVNRKLAEIDNQLNHAPSGVINTVKFLIEYVIDVCKDPSILLTLLKDIQMIIYASDAWVKAMAITSLLASFGLLTIQSLGLGMLVSELLFVGRAERRGYLYLTPQGEDTNELVAKWAAGLMGGVSALAGFHSAKSWPEGIDKFIKNLSSVSNSWFKLLSESCSFAVDYLIHLVGLDVPDMSALAQLKNNPIDVQKWATRVLWLVKPANRSDVLTNHDLRAEVSQLYEDGSKVVKILVEDKKYPVQGATFMALWRQLCDLYSESGEIPTSIQANQTPVVIWLHGAPGIGKSEVAKKLAASLAAMLDIHYEGDPFFVRTPRKFWDGYTNQPIVIFDDALQVATPEIQSAFFTDWFGLVTNAPYSPEFSAISEKKKFITPKIIIVNSNQAYPTVNSVASQGAFLRRRDFLIQVSLDKNLCDKYPNLISASDMRIPIEILKDYSHLRFGAHTSVLDKTSSVEGSYTLPEIVALLAERSLILRERRLQSAQTQTTIASSLKLEQIENTRKEILGLVDKEVAGKLLGKIGETISQLSPQGTDCTPDKPWRQTVATPSEVCLFDCEHRKVICVNDLHGVKIQHPDICCCCGTITAIVETKPGKSEFFVIGDGPCPQIERDRAFDNLVADISLSYSKMPGVELYPIPSFRTPSPVVKTIKLPQLDSWLKEKVKSFWNKIPFRYLIPLAVAVGALLICKGLGVLEKLKSFTSKVTGAGSAPKHHHVTPQIASSGSVQTPRMVPQRPVLRPQGSTSDLIPRLRRNRVKLTVIWASGRESQLHGLFIADRLAIVPNHLFHFKKEEIAGYRVTLFGVKEGGCIELGPDAIKVTRIGEYDLAAVQFICNRVPRAKNIFKTLVKEPQLSYISTYMGLLDVQDTETRIREVMTNRVQTMTTYEHKIVGYTLYLDGFSYDIRGDGKCGSVLVDERTGLICGMHIAGNEELGFSTLITQEMVEPFMETESLDVEEPDLKEGGMVEPRGEYIPIGKLPNPQAINTPLTTSIAKSSCVGMLTDPVRLPAQFIEPGESVPGLTNLTLGVEKLVKPTKTWPQVHIEKVRRWRQAKALAMTPVIQSVKIRSLQEAICGIPGVEQMQPLKRKTSVGWPLCTEKGKGSKKEDWIKFLETSEGLLVDSLDPKLVELYTTELEKRKEGIIPFSPYTVFMKDERLKRGKKPRLIEGCPLPQLMIYRQYTMDYWAAYHKHHKLMGHAIGINIHGPEWSELARDLLAKGDKVCCGDYSGFGPQLDVGLVLDICDDMNAWYEKYQTDGRENLPEQNRVRRTLFESNAFNHIIARDTVIQVLCGSASGNPVTAPINSEVNMRMLGLVWLHNFEGTVLEDLSNFDENVCTRVYGDDIIFSMNPAIRELWNNETLQTTFREVGVTYTDADKSTGAIRKYCDLGDATFLKCFFVPHPTRGTGYFLAGLEKPMIEDIPNWIRKPYIDKVEASLLNSVEAVHLAYGHGFEYYEHIRSKVVSYWTSKGKVPAIREWSYLDAMFFGELDDYGLPEFFQPQQWA